MGLTLIMGIGMRKRFGSKIVLLGLLLFWALNSSAGETKARLYDRIGGYDAISHFSNGLIDGFYSDSRLSRFTEGVTPPIEVVERDKQLTTEYLCKIAGGPCFYIGKDMHTTHKDMKITKEEWAALMDHAIRLASVWNIEPADKEEFLKLFDNIKY